MNGFLATILGGITIIAGIYLAIHYATNVGSEAKAGTSAFAKVSKTFQGGPGL